MPIDLHILGAVDTYGYWYASGEYVNDDGLTLEPDGNTNQYLINAEIDESDGTSILLYINTISVASNYNDSNGCNSMNKNDYLNKVYIYTPQ